MEVSELGLKKSYIHKKLSFLANLLVIQYFCLTLTIKGQPSPIFYILFFNPSSSPRLPNAISPLYWIIIPIIRHFLPTWC